MPEWGVPWLFTAPRNLLARFSRLEFRALQEPEFGKNDVVKTQAKQGAKPRRAFHSPKLIRLGRVFDLTQSAVMVGVMNDAMSAP